MYRKMGSRVYIMYIFTGTLLTDSDVLLLPELMPCNASYAHT